MPTGLHAAIQNRIDAFQDLTPVEFHGLWGHSNAQFLEGRMVGAGVIDVPSYWYSPSSRSCLGFWKFTGQSLDNDAVQETTLFTLIDDVMGELAYRVFIGTTKGKEHIGFTVNLNIKKADMAPNARRFFFEATAESVTERKVAIKCPLYDAMTGKLLLVARAVFVFTPIANIAKQTNVEDANSDRDHSPGSSDVVLSLPSARSLAADELYQLGQVMNFLPHGTINHTRGSISVDDKRLVVSLDFGKNISGPPIYVHGGILGTVLFNASALLFTKHTGISATLVDAAERDINYHRGVPLECQNAAIEATVESSGNDKVVVFATLMRNKHVYTTLKTIFTLPQSSSKL
ncbi:hypothetical protein IWW51_002053 [Coemansia sp. RSA 2702]|nr:hypothetical protein IWW51_002053 [Coemansia sp. RSA 2702]